jgi:hypothetical protein
MGRPRKNPTDRRKTIGVTPSAETRRWLDPQVGPGKRWSTYTHFFDWAASYIQGKDKELEEVLERSRASDDR